MHDITSNCILTQTKVLQEVLELGRTDSRETSGTEIVKFEKSIDVTYYSGNIIYIL